MRSRFSWSIPALSLIILVQLAAPIAIAADGQRRVLCVHGIEPGNALSVRSGPGKEHAAVGQLPAKACNVELVGRCDGGWCEMALGSTAGWVDTRFIGVYELPGTRAEAPTPVPKVQSEPRRVPLETGESRRSPRVVEQGSAPTGACVARVERWDTLRIRSGPGRSYDEIGEIPSRACGVGVVGGCRDRWCRIVWRGRSGWVNTYYLD